MAFDRERDQMVEKQLRPRGVTDKRVLDAMRAVPRHLFVPEALRHSAYRDTPLPIGEGQTISQPFIVALMTQALELKGDETVLEIGTGSGYQTAVLSQLAYQVFSIERIRPLAVRARKVLDELRVQRVLIKIDDGSVGLPAHAPYDRIIVTAGAPGIPRALLEQLKPGGIMVVPVGEQQDQRLVKLRKTAEGIAEEDLGGVRFVPLIGEEGWKA
ncbi:MAG: protein-L-isoaspartate(D-aspartate) O-methyltransferase [Candidatus Methylomirabilis sp.]|nr:protein-L-isoaspartate(D-aspartate) O-methyltransferase [Deltaproteobacteria bacterium]